MKKVYISGKISGLDLKQVKEKFATIERNLHKTYDIVFNPCDTIDYVGEEADWTEYMKIHLHTILNNKPDVFMLSDWKSSRGARIEHFLAKEMGLNINFPLSFSEFIKNEYYAKGIKKIHIDNADMLLQKLTNVKIATISMNYI